MKFNHPRGLAIFVSLCCATTIVLMMVALLLLRVWTPQWYAYLLLPFISAAVVYFVTYWAVKKFIYNKVKIIYKNIFSQKIRRDTKKEISTNPKLLEDVYEKVEDWMVSNEAEIKKLKDQESFRREFLGNLAHELKTPVFSIQGYILTLLEGGLEDPNINRMFLERAANGVDRITHILEDLDMITRLESGNSELFLKKVNIVQLAQEVIDSVEMQAAVKNIKIKFNHKYEKPIYVRCDSGRIGQVFTNLLINSINYGKEGGKTDIRFFDMDEKILVEVADNGLGISQDHLPRIFERFYRVDKSRSRNEGGSGLGLAIVKHIIEAHRQSINVRSTEDVGTTFSFTLDKYK